jgi:hypothetical protein
MKNRSENWLLACLAICCLAPSSALASNQVIRQNFSFRVPEGGSALIYLVGAGLTCVGAMFLRSKLAKRSH